MLEDRLCMNPCLELHIVYPWHCSPPRLENNERNRHVLAARLAGYILDEMGLRGMLRRLLRTSYRYAMLSPKDIVEVTDPAVQPHELHNSEQEAEGPSRNSS